VLAPIRATGLAGATTASAEAVEGLSNNAAAPGVRELYSLKWFDYDLSASVSFPGAFGGSDFSNRGENADPRLRRRTNRFLAFDGGLQLQFGAFGIAASADVLQYDIEGTGGASPLELSLGRAHLTAAHAFFGEQLVVGGGIRVVYARAGTEDADVRMLGVAPQLGAIVKPTGAPYRLGMTARAPVEAGPIPIGGSTTEVQPDGTRVATAGSFVLPERITQPWELEVGIAYQLGPRPLNPAWINPREHERELEESIASQRRARAAQHRLELGRMPSATPADRDERARRAALLRREEEMARAIEDALLRDRKDRLYDVRRARYLNWPRERVLFLASVLVTGPSSDAVALEGFLDQRREIVGRTVSFSPRIAAESEPVANLLRVRAGIYLEPSRFADSSTRQHFTFGGDLRLFSWGVFGLFAETTWRLSAFLDVAPRYTNFGFGLGAWR
jgi:hypothetical protein